MAWTRTDARWCAAKRTRYACTTKEYQVRTAKVNPLLVFEDHVVVNRGNNGTVVDRSNFISQVIV